MPAAVGIPLPPSIEANEGGPVEFADDVDDDGAAAVMPQPPADAAAAAERCCWAFADAEDGNGGPISCEPESMLDDV